MDNVVVFTEYIAWYSVAFTPTIVSLTDPFACVVD